VNVSDILDIVGDFSVSGSNVTDEQRTSFLRYLNLYKDSLYRKTAAMNGNLLQTQLFSGAYDSGVGLSLTGTTNLMFITSVINLKNNRVLKQKSQIEAYQLWYNNDEWKSGVPQIYTLLSSYTTDEFVVFIYPLPSDDVSMVVGYIENPEDFTEETPSVAIPFPQLYHQLLVDGTLWYVFQEEGGFKDSVKASEAKNRCMQGEQELMSFLQNTFHESSEVMTDV